MAGRFSFLKHEQITSSYPKRSISIETTHNELRKLASNLGNGHDPEGSLVLDWMSDKIYLSVHYCLLA